MHVCVGRPRGGMTTTTKVTSTLRRKVGLKRFHYRRRKIEEHFKSVEPVSIEKTQKRHICFNDDVSVVLNCPGFYTYCTDYILEWVGNRGKATCPVCQVPVTSMLYRNKPVPLPVVPGSGGSLPTNPPAKKQKKNTIRHARHWGI